MNVNLVRSIFKQVATTLRQLHTMHIIHRDIKPENILVELDDSDRPNSVNVFLSDFGFAMKLEVLHKENRYSAVGTPSYFPYEMHLKRVKEGESKERIFYDERADIWCLGVLLYDMLYGRTPFASQEKEEVRRKI